jgi:adenylate cyclase
MPAISYAPDALRIDARERQTLLEAALAAGIPHAHVCGACARCSTCRVIVLEGIENLDPPNDKERALAARLRLPPEVRIACQATVRGPVRVRRLVLDEDDVALVRRGRVATAATEAPAGAEMRVAILFSDIRGFTSFSEALLPYDVIHVLNRHFEAMGQVIAAEGGIINNYMGDGLMALFGVDGRADAAMRAVRAALAMLAASEKLQPYLMSSYGRAFDIGVGIHYGEAVIGPVGASDRKAITAIGDAVNFASRIESANKDVGTRLLVSEAVRREVEGRVTVGRTACMPVKGKTGEHTLYEITGLAERA